MRSLRKSNILFLSLFIFTGCASSLYKVRAQYKSLYEVTFSPDRIILECEFITDYTGDIPEPHGFMMHVLDDKKTVFTAIQGNVLYKGDCDRRLNRIDEILKKGKIISLGGTGSLETSYGKSDAKYFFPKHGTYPSNGHVLQFLAIWNEHGLCYGAYEGDEKPCPRDGFPLQN